MAERLGQEEPGPQRSCLYSWVQQSVRRFRLSFRADRPGFRRAQRARAGDLAVARQPARLWL